MSDKYVPEWDKEYYTMLLKKTVIESMIEEVIHCRAIEKGWTNVKARTEIISLLDDNTRDEAVLIKCLETTLAGIRNRITDKEEDEE